MTKLEQRDGAFWEDEPEPQTISRPLQESIDILLKVIVVLSILAWVIFVVGIFYLLKPILSWIFLVYMFIMLGIGILINRRRKSNLQNVTHIQQQASEITKATLIGSAVHVAGHPLLEREQKVVLALIPPDLAIYPYEIAQPLFIIPLRDIISLQTVVYDDERVPHVDVLDSTAQAIQMVIKNDGGQVTCLFRRMKKARPIDWYHAIQKAKNTGNE